MLSFFHFSFWKFASEDEVPAGVHTDAISCLQASLPWAALYHLATFKTDSFIHSITMRASQGQVPA